MLKGNSYTNSIFNILPFPSPISFMPLIWYSYKLAKRFSDYYLLLQWFSFNILLLFLNVIKIFFDVVFLNFSNQIIHFVVIVIICKLFYIINIMEKFIRITLSCPTFQSLNEKVKTFSVFTVVKIFCTQYFYQG